MLKQCRYRTLILISALGWIEYFFFLLAHYTDSHHNLLIALLMILATLLLYFVNIKKYIVLIFLIEYILVASGKIKPININLKHPLMFLFGIILLIIMWIFNWFALGITR